MPIETKDAPAVGPEQHEPETLPAVRDDDDLSGVEERALVARARAPIATTALPTGAEWEALATIASRLSSTEFVPKELRGKQEAVLACMMYGRELGFAPMQSLQKIHVIDGRPSMAADLMLAKMREGGVQILASESTRERAWIKARRRDTGEEAEVEWTMAEAITITEKNGKRLVDKANWKNYPADMLWARCVGRLARRLASDLLAGVVYSTEEMEDWTDDDGAYEQSAAAAEPTFDPSRQAVLGAPTGGWKQIVALLQETDPSVDWPATLADICEAVYGIRSIRDLSEEDARAFGIRSANFASEHANNRSGDWPPESDVVERIMGWAYDGHVVELRPRVTQGGEEAAGDPQQTLDAQEEPAGASVEPDPEEEVVHDVEVVDEADLPDFGEEAS